MTLRLLAYPLATFVAIAGALVLALGADSAPAASACDEVAGRREHPRHFVRSLRRGESGCFRAGRAYRSPRRPIVVERPHVTLTSTPGARRATLVGRLWLARRADGAVIRHNRIHDCGRLPATNRQHGIYMAHARRTVIRDNWIYGNADRGIQLYPNADRATITGNVIDDNGQGIIFSGDEGDRSEDNLAEGNVITNSKIRYNVQAYWERRRGSGNVVRGNCLWAPQGTRRGSPLGSGIESPREGFVARRNLIARPGYVSRRTGDYRLRAKSPCRTIRG